MNTLKAVILDASEFRRIEDSILNNMRLGESGQDIQFHDIDIGAVHLNKVLVTNYKVEVDQTYFTDPGDTHKKVQLLFRLTLDFIRAVPRERPEFPCG